MNLSDADCREIRGVLGGKGTNYRYADIALWLRKADFVPPKGDGSHCWWRHPSGKRVLLVNKGHGQLLPVYVKRAARAIVELGGCT